jgi:quercetin dioxygenase-like cupin family protein
MTTDGPPGVPTSSVVVDDLPWVVYESEYGRTESKLLRVSLAENSYTIMIRWSAGSRVPTHRHFGSVHAWTLAGQWRYTEYDWVARPGTYVFEPPGTVHSLCVDEDTEALFVVNGGQVDLGPDGQILYAIDAGMSLAVYEAALHAMGVELPPGLVVGRTPGSPTATPDGMLGDIAKYLLNRDAETPGA